jgi:hypothetical protein
VIKGLDGGEYEGNGVVDKEKKETKVTKRDKEGQRNGRGRGRGGQGRTGVGGTGGGVHTNKLSFKAKTDWEKVLAHII